MEGAAAMDFIFMLTRSDQTVEDCLEVFELVRPLGLGHVGFKDIGVDMATLASLTREIKASGATCYLEVVSVSREAALNSARAAVELGVDRLMGGTEVADTLEILKGSGIGYYPFPGFPHDHPTKLGGSAADVSAQCRGFMESGCAGADLLAYRATEADPLALVRAAREGLGDGHLVVAGSVDTPEQIADLTAAGADAFTIGTAAFSGAFSPTRGSLLSQLRDILVASGLGSAAPANSRLYAGG